MTTPLLELFRPVGLEELLLIFASGMRAFPARPPEQPIFYPATTEAYAAQIAREWNASVPGGAGYVTRFLVPANYVARFKRKHEEMWVPAPELPNFNAHIAGQIEVVDAYFSKDFGTAIRETYRDKLLDLIGDPSGLDDAIRANAAALYAHAPYWMRTCGPNLKDLENRRLLQELEHCWSETVSAIAWPKIRV